MIHLSLIGIGAGNPEHLSLQAIDAIGRCDVILIPHKGAQKDDLAQARRAICARVLDGDGPRLHEFALPERDPQIADYTARVTHWHDAIARVWQREICACLPQGGRVGFLVWGDPSLYDSTLRIAERLQSVMAVTLQVIPGITAIAALTAGHAIALNDVGGSVTITTGRRLRADGWPEGAQTVVVMLDQGGAFSAIAPQGIDIWWSAYAGMAQEIRLCGPLSQVGPRILEARAEARARHGWVMDIYLLRREMTAQGGRTD
ncbi:precorrin-6A synthase (deacetylating) [Rhodobacteraceae bacterium]|nr:precorrin-6A synthase (deacetylating) [Paracoccaceae bacterium]